MAFKLFSKKEKLPLPKIPIQKQELFLRKTQAKYNSTGRSETSPASETIETGARFIYLEDYEKIMNNTQQIRKKLTSAEDIIQNTEKLKALHEREIKKLLKIIEQTEKKISRAESIISTGETIE